MIAILEWTQSNVQQNIEQLQTPTMGLTSNKKSTTREPSPLNGQQPKPPWGLNAFYWYQIFAIDSAVVEVQEMFSSHGSILTNAMYHHGETFDFCFIQLDFTGTLNTVCLIKINFIYQHCLFDTIRIQF